MEREYTTRNLADVISFQVYSIPTEYFCNIICEQTKLRKNQTKKRNDMIDLLTEALMGHASNDEEVKRQGRNSMLSRIQRQLTKTS